MGINKLGVSLGTPEFGVGLGIDELGVSLGTSELGVGLGIDELGVSAVGIVELVF